MLSDLRKYLGNAEDISNDDKNYTMNFYKKLHYIDTLNQVVIDTVHDKILMGYGNYNSNIMILIDSKDHLSDVVAVVKPFMDNMHISLWNTYITVVKKSSASNNMYSNVYNEAILNEINAVNPSLLYIFEENNNIKTLINQSTNKIPKLSNIVIKEININDVLFLADAENKKNNDDEYIVKRNDVWKSIRAMMNYKDKEITE